MRVFLAAATLAALAGCANQPTYYYRMASAGDGDLLKDQAQCDYETSAATQAPDRSIRSTFAQDMDRGWRQADLMTRCMRAKGWRQEQGAVEPPAPTHNPYASAPR